jgi:hypothetical protein
MVRARLDATQDFFAVDRHLGRGDDAQTHPIAVNGHDADDHVMIVQLDHDLFIHFAS